MRRPFLVLGWSLALGGCGEDPEPAAPPAGRARVRELDASGRLKEAAEMDKVVKTEAEWRRLLTPEQYQVTRERGTERSCSGAFWNHHEPGTYACVCCGLPLFKSASKFESGTGWPSYGEPVCPENVATRPDGSHGMERTEILCARCDAHLGHVFEDGPKPTGRRYCVNSASLVFAPEKPAAKAVFGGG